MTTAVIVTVGNLENRNYNLESENVSKETPRQNTNVTTCVLGFHLLQNTTIQTKLGRKGLICLCFHNMVHHKKVREGTQGRNLNARIGSEAMEEPGLLDHFS